MKRIFYLLILTVFFGNISINAQTLQAYEKKAANAYSAANFSAALAYYNQLLEINANRVDALFYGADAAAHLRAYHLAESYYNNIPDSLKNGHYEATDYSLATVKKGLMKYDEAIVSFQKYISEHPNGVFKNNALAEIDNCNWAKLAIANPKNINIQHFTESVNTVYSDLAPVHYNGALYYTSLFQNNITNTAQLGLLVKKDNSEQQSLSDIIETNEGEQSGQVAFTENGNRVFYTICKKQENNTYHCDIWFRNKQTNGKWGKPQMIQEPVNSKLFTTTQPTVGKDANGKEYLYFVSDRVGGKGDMDIWRSAFEGDNFETPENITSINTSKDDITPFFHNGTQTLYFSSTDYQNMGGLDIFKSKNNNNSWTQPENLGYPLNSSYDDLYFSFDSDNGSGWFSSNRPGNLCANPDKECVCDDIYNYNIKADMKALTFNEKNQKSLAGVTLQLLDLTTNSIDTIVVNNIDNNFELSLHFGKNYQVIAQKHNYLPDTLYFNTKGLIEDTHIPLNLYLDPLISVETRVLDIVSKKIINDAHIVMENKNLIHQNEYFITPYIPNRSQKMIISSEGYLTDTITLTALKDFTEPMVITQVVYLAQFVDLPLAIYFNNDQPGKSSETTTVTNYKESFESYYAEKAHFIAEYTRGLSAEQKQFYTNELASFFDSDVQKGYQKLTLFSQTLFDYLQAGYQLEIVLEGYASPLAGAEYNRRLTQRRIDCLINHFETWNDGAISNYIANKNLKFTLEPHGEEMSPQTVTDDAKNRKESVFSVAASKERRVRIIDVRRLPGVITILNKEILSDKMIAKKEIE